MFIFGLFWVQFWLVSINHLLSTFYDEIFSIQVGQNHFESEFIMKRVAEVTVRRNRVKELSNSRRNRLRDNLLYAKFVRDVSEADVWIDERKKQLDAETSLGEVTTLEEKVFLYSCIDFDYLY